MMHEAPEQYEKCDQIDTERKHIQNIKNGTNYRQTVVTIIKAQMIWIYELDSVPYMCLGIR